VRRIFKTEAEFVKKFKDYLKYCEKNEDMPNIAGFCVYAKIAKNSYYSQKKIYPDGFSQVEDMLENAVINAKKVSPAMKKFYMENKMNYNDKQLLQHDITVSFNIPRPPKE
jgi:hypothetical protein